MFNVFLFYKRFHSTLSTQKANLNMGWDYKILKQFTWHFHESYFMDSKKLISPKSMNFPIQ